MADKINTNYKLIEPEVGASQDSWGSKLNDNWNKVDSLLHGDSFTDLNANIVKKIAPDLEGGQFKIDGVAVTASAADLNATTGILDSPALTGTPTAPTATSDTDTSQIATTEFVQSLISSAIASTKEALYPVGSIYTNATSTANPATLLGFGTWVEFGSGRVLVGQNTSDASFNTLQETGGSKNAVAVSHTHSFSGTTSTNGNHTHTVPINWSNTNGYINNNGPGTGLTNAYNPTTSAAGNHNHTFSGTTGSSGESGTNKNLQPYIVVKMWKRTA
jgi:hypothetical protein